MKTYTIEELQQQAHEERDLYYSTKRLANHTTDPHEICNIWERASKYWDNAIEIEKQIAKLSTPDYLSSEEYDLMNEDELNRITSFNL